MAINRTQIAAQPLTQDTNVVIEIVYVEPTNPLSTPMTPNKVFGFYDSALDSVRLYVVSDSGLQALPVV